MRICAVPECKNKAVHGVTSVCREHTHRKGYCQCKKCMESRSVVTLKPVPWEEEEVAF